MPLARLKKCRDAYLTKPEAEPKVGKSNQKATALMALFNKRVKDFLYLHGLDENDLAHVEYAIGKITEDENGSGQ